MGSDRLYSENHLWVLRDGNNAKIGISDYAQEKLGAVMFVNLPDVGEELKEGSRFGDIESIKTVSDLISPITGKVLCVNDILQDEPERINEDPFGSWLIEAEISSVSGKLMAEDVYLSVKEKL